ncbi:MAG: CoA activase, partial [Parafannyhessea umbonata]|nr:CoA activase [Parafannyhessea umbonata]
AEMCDLIENGTPNIIVCSPFACLPNHVVGKSVIKRLRQMHHESNIVAVDYDPGASEVNQLNRIKLMISVAKENFKQAQAAGDPDAKFTLTNEDDPTTRVIPNFEEYGHLRRKGELEDHIVNEGAPVSGGYAAYGTMVDEDGGVTVGRGEGRIHLTREQLDAIEDAKRRAGVR